mgnify:CR=1 FL=1
MVIQGVETNIEDQLRLVRSKAFFKGEYDTLALQNILEEERGTAWNHNMVRFHSPGRARCQNVPLRLRGYAGNPQFPLNAR